MNLFLTLNARSFIYDETVFKELKFRLKMLLFNTHFCTTHIKLPENSANVNFYFYSCNLFYSFLFRCIKICRLSNVI